MTRVTSRPMKAPPAPVLLVLEALACGVRVPTPDGHGIRMAHGRIMAVADRDGEDLVVGPSVYDRFTDLVGLAQSLSPEDLGALTFALAERRALAHTC